MGLFTFGGNNNAIGIDIGSSAVKVVQLKKSPNGPELVNYGIMPLPPDAMGENEVNDPAAVAGAIKDLMKSKKIKPERNFASISGQNVIMRFTKLPTMTEEEREQSVRIEAQQYVPYAIEEVSITHAVLNTVEDDEEGEGGGGRDTVLLVVAQKALIGSYTEVLRQSGITPELVDVDTIAAINALESSYMQTAHDEEGGEVVAIIDSGARTTNISVLKSGVLLFTRNIPIAGNDVTARIAEVMRQESEQAEAIKIEEAEIGVDEMSGNDLSEVVRSTVEELASEIRRSFDYFKAQSREPLIHKIILSGGSSNLRGFNTFLSNELGVDVHMGNPLEGLSVTAPDPDELYNGLQQFTVAIGLALRGVED